MQEDMHYYGTYALARAAGLKVEHASTIAYAAQYVDDATMNTSEAHDDGGMFLTVATAHTNSEAVSNAVADHTEQRQVWVPFHFFPGNQGFTLSDKLSCVQDSELAREMVQNHIQHAAEVKQEYGLALMGIMAHVYADTFAHYGFSGVSSRNNEVDGNSFELDVQNDEVKAYIMNKLSSFLTKYAPRFIIKNYRWLVSEGAENITGALGHGGVGTYPDRPFLRWRFKYEDGRDSGWRDNRISFMQACEKLHRAFSDFATRAGLSSEPVDFESIRASVEKIIALESAKQGRIQAWVNAIQTGELFTPETNEALHYAHSDWELQKDGFKTLPSSQQVLGADVYRYHQAAIYHRDYTLKQLLPRHGIVIL